MSLRRFPVEKYASLELNQVSFPKTGMVISQTPLGSAFTAEHPCENGMWVIGDKAAGVISAPAAVTDKLLGIVYTTEKEYDIFHYGLKTFGRKIAGDYPRVGLLSVGETFTTNCLQYDEDDFLATQTKTSEEVLMDALNDITLHPLYVIPGVAADTAWGKAVPQIVKSEPQSGAYAKIVKFYTVPNGEKGVKYQIVSLG